MDTYDIIVIGAGPAGLSCAIHAAAGSRVLLLEKNPGPGRKLRISGSGQCNITHGGDIRAFFHHYGDHGAFLRPALMNFTNRDLVALFESRGLPLTEEPEGKIFPATRKSADVIRVLLDLVRENNVTFKCGEAVQEVAKSGDMFTVTTSRGMYRGHELVIATGGKSYPGTGSTGDGYRFAQALGHTVTALKPSLVPVHVREYPFSDLSGISFREVTLSLFREGKKVHEHAGDLLFTHSGLSGPGILDFSRYIEPGDTLKISFLPKKRREAFVHELAGKLLASGTLRVRTILAGYQLPERFIDKVLILSGIPPELTGAHFSVPARKRLVESLTGFPCVIAGPGSFEEAMVTRGGISLDEIDLKTMESRLVSGLYFTGEVLDIDGDTGGYNIQAAFSTGVLAAQSILKRIWSGRQQKKC